jgi:nucleoside-diphosphate-sugar epimerase
MRYFMTGATGFLGGRLALQLRQAGHEVVALVRDPAKGAALAAAGVELHAGDVTDRASLVAPMRGADGVFHLAAWYKIGAKDPSPAYAINVEGTRNVLATMRDLGIPKGVYTSTIAIFSDTHGVLVDESYRHDGPFLSVYDETKWRAHYEVALPLIAQGLPLVVVLPGLIYGPGDQGPSHAAWVEYLTGRMPLVPKRTGFSWGHVDDEARGHVLAMERGRPGESYILAGPPHTLLEALEMAAAITGIKVPRLRLGPAAMRAMAVLMQGVGAVAPLPDHLCAEAIRVVAGVTYQASNAKARRELGFDPRPLAAGLPETLRWEMEQLGAEKRPETPRGNW